LLNARRPDLANKMEWVSKTTGDGLGYDVLSFDESSNYGLYIEVKTTNSDPATGFVLTANELNFGKSHTKQFVIYRVYDFKNHARVLRLEGDPSTVLDLQP
jgi:hypothetical protein